jgi:hypothetical protein
MLAQGSPANNPEGNPVFRSAPHQVLLTALLTLAPIQALSAEPVLSPLQRTQMAELREKAKVDWRQSQSHQGDASYGPIFLVLALHDPDPKAVNRWLIMADEVYSPRPEATPNRRLEQIGNDFRAVALWASRHKDDNIRNTSTRMLSSCLGNPDPQAQQRAIECALRDTNPAVRYGAIHAFWFPVNFQPVVDGAVADCLLQCLQERHSFPLTAALELCRRTYRKKRKFPTALEPRLDTQLRQLLSHPEPVISGHAILALSLLKQAREEDARWLYPLLQHRHPFVRGCALDALAEFANPRSLQRMIPLLDDLEMPMVECPVPDTGTGIQTSIPYTPNNHHYSIQEFALRAIQQASSKTSTPFVFEATPSRAGKKPGKVKTVTLQVGRPGLDPARLASLAAQAREAKQWWSTNIRSLGPQD